MATSEEINQFLIGLDDKSAILVTKYTRMAVLIKKFTETGHPMAEEMVEAFGELVLADTDYAVGTLEAIELLVRSQSST